MQTLKPVFFFTFAKKQSISETLIVFIPPFMTSAKEIVITF